MPATIGNMKNNTNESVQKEYENYKRLDKLNLDFIDKVYYLMYHEQNGIYGLITGSVGISINRMDKKPSKQMPDFKIVLEKHGYKKLNITERNIIYSEKLDKYFLTNLQDIVNLKEIDEKSLQQEKSISQKTNNKM